MAERLPISLPEVYRRVNSIEDPVKRAGAQAFAGVYAPTLKLPEYDRSPLTRITMRNHALRVKEFAIHEAESELGIQTSTETEVFDFRDADVSARQAGLLGIDLLGLSLRTRNLLFTSNIKDLAALNKLSTRNLMRLSNAGVKSVKEIQSKLNEARGISAAEVEDRIAGVFTAREEEAEQEKNKRQLETGQSIREAAEFLFDVGNKLGDDVTLESLYTGTDRDYNFEVPEEWQAAIAQLKPGHKGAVNGSLSVAMFRRHLHTLGEIRRMPANQLADMFGPNRAIFFKNAFGVPVSDL